jgi:hypothetical protein
MKKIFLPILICILIHSSSLAQVFRPDHDTTYYRSYKGSIICRVYLSRKYAVLKLVPPSYLESMSYHANTTLSIGVGITYKSLSVSISKGLGDFLSSEDKKGKTSFTDLQLRLYKRKWTIDAIASFSRGYYLSPQGLAAPAGQSYYIRPDFGTQVAGVAVYRVLNDQKFSYGAALSQNAWQKKSAGSFLLGGEAFYLTSNADSAFVPNQLDTTFDQRNIRKFHLFEIGPGAGYAYTLVVKEHAFLMASFNVGLNFSYSREIGNDKGTKIGVWGDYTFRIGAGYNANKWNVGLSWLATRISSEGHTSLYKYIYNAGGYKLVYARRFAIGHKMRRILD